MYFGDVVDGRMELSEIGKWAYQCVEKIETINDNVFVPEFVVMPNHVHLIVIMDNMPELPDDGRLPQYDRLPQCDSPTAPTGNNVHDGGSVGLPYHDSRLYESDGNFRLPQCDSPTAPTGNNVHDGGSVGLPYHDSRLYESDGNFRLPRCDSPTTPDDNGNPEDWVVGLPYHDSRIDNNSEINEEMQCRANCCGRLSHIIGQFKSAVTKYANQRKIPFMWQPRFHDHIIRNGVEMNRVADYIQNNPMKWELDRFYKKR